MSTKQPVVSVDPVALQYVYNCGLTVILTARKCPPYVGRRALPGVMLLPGESVEDAANRGLADKCGIAADQIVYRFAGRYDDTRNRDPRGATISLTQVIVLRREVFGYDGTWHAPVARLNSLPFAHNQIIDGALADIAARLWTDRLVIPAFLGDTFTTVQVARLANTLGAGRTNLSRKLSTMFTNTEQRGVMTRGRPARVWTLNE